MADTPSRSATRTIVWIVLVASLIALAVWMRGCAGSSVGIRTAPVTHADLVTPLSTNGKVQALDDFQAHASQPGVVRDVYVSVGSRVAEGQLLLRMDDADARHQIAAAQAGLSAAQNTMANMRQGGTAEERMAAHNDLQTAQTQATSAQTSLTALQNLAAAGAASANEVAAARQRLSDANARVAQLRAHDAGRYATGDLSAQQGQVTSAASTLAAARDNLNSVLIRAPFGGTVYDLGVAPNDYVQAGADLLDMADLRHLQVHAYFDEPEVGKLRVGQPVRITWDAQPNRTWHGHIELPPTTIKNYGTRNVGEALITVDDPDGVLLPNTNVTATVIISQRYNVLTVPREALHTQGTENYVFVVDHDVLHRRSVQVGGLNLTRVEITSGLQDGDVVALNAVNNSELADGMKIQVQN